MTRRHVNCTMPRSTVLEMNRRVPPRQRSRFIELCARWRLAEGAEKEQLSAAIDVLLREHSSSTDAAALDDRLKI